MAKDKLLTIRVDSKLLKELSQKLGVDDSKTIRACMNCTANVLNNFFGGEVTLIFKREKKNEEKEMYKTV